MASWRMYSKYRESFPDRELHTNQNGWRYRGGQRPLIIWAAAVAPQHPTAFALLSPLFFLLFIASSSSCNPPQLPLEQLSRYFQKKKKKKKTARFQTGTRFFFLFLQKYSDRSSSSNSKSTIVIIYVSLSIHPGDAWPPVLPSSREYCYGRHVFFRVRRWSSRSADAWMGKTKYEIKFKTRVDSTSRSGRSTTSPHSWRD